MKVTFIFTGRRGIAILLGIIAALFLRFWLYDPASKPELRAEIQRFVHFDILQSELPQIDSSAPEEIAEKFKNFKGVPEDLTFVIENVSVAHSIFRLGINPKVVAHVLYSRNVDDERKLFEGYYLCNNPFGLEWNCLRKVGALSYYMAYF